MRGRRALIMTNVTRSLSITIRKKVTPIKKKRVDSQWLFKNEMKWTDTKKVSEAF